MNRQAFCSACAAVMALGLVTVAFSQTATTPPGLPGIAGASVAPPAGGPADAAEREKIWNSPTMLRARAWVQEYCQRSAKITPAEAQQYMTELQNMSPVQMKLWLLKFDHEEEMIRQQQSAFEQTRQAGVAQATAVNSSAQQAYSNINRDETEAAEVNQQSINNEQQLAAERGLQNTQDRDAADAAVGQPWGGLYGPYGGYPYMGYGYNPLGGYHVHVHVHPQ